jgi:flagellar hook-length control protein FliK
MPLATDAVRVAPVAMDAGMTTMTNTGPGSVRGGSPSAAEMGAGQTPRFTPHTANQLAAQISQRFANGSRVFGIRLDPAELGRVDIRMELSQNNRVRATLTVERGDTLAEMQRSTRDLERALNDAGLELAEDGLTFQLSEGSGDEQSAEPQQGGSFNVYGQDDDGAQELGAEIDTGPADAYGFRLSRRDGVDLRV